MKLLLFSVTNGKKPIELREYLAETGRVGWDGTSSLPCELTEVLGKARTRAEQLAEGAVYLNRLTLHLVGPVQGIRAYYYEVSFQPEDVDSERVEFALDLYGEPIEPETRFFDTQKAYTQYVYGNKDTGKKR